MANFKPTKGNRLDSTRLDGAGENKRETKTVLEKIEGVSLEYCPAFATQSNDLAEHLVKDMSLRARVMLTGTGLTEDLPAEAIHHESWIINRPS